MNDNNYSLVDLVENMYFQQWVKQPDANKHVFWQTWAKQHADNEEMIDQGRQLLLFLQNPAEDVVSKEEKEELKTKLKKRIFG
jgi:accessory colonization factor AcfC